MFLVICIHLIYVYLPNPSAQARCDTRSIFNKSLTGLNSDFSLYLTVWHIKVKEFYLLGHLLTAGGRIVGCIPLPTVLALCEIQTASISIWTLVAVSISNNDNHYTSYISIYIRTHTHTHTHIYIYIYIYIYDLNILIIYAKSYAYTH